METLKKKVKERKTLVRKCHICGQVTQASNEQEKCLSCGKAFLPLNYFKKIHDHCDEKEYKELFLHCDELEEDDLIKGIYVIW
jgi:rRNA maturation endonuclease Nob1